MRVFLTVIFKVIVLTCMFIYIHYLYKLALQMLEHFGSAIYIYVGFTLEIAINIIIPKRDKKVACQKIYAM